MSDFSRKREARAMADWSIKMVAVQHPTPDLKADFLPDLSTAKRRDPLVVQQGDLVSWNNTTGDEHWPWVVSAQNAPPVDPPPNGNHLTSGVVKPGTSSDNYYVDLPAGTTIYYCCKCHPAERASIVVVPFGQSTVPPAA
jgi:hypothetical protein